MRLAEDAGLHSVWVPHHTLMPVEYDSVYPYQGSQRLPFPPNTIYGDALGVLAHVAAVTERIRLATNVVPLITQHPLALAKQAATVDHLSGGRLELGLGGGWLREEGEILGQPTDRRGARLAEAVSLLRAAWTGEPFTHDGRFWSVPASVICPAPSQGSRIPLWIGGGGPAVMRTVREDGAGLVLPPWQAGRDMLARLRPELPHTPFAIPLEVPSDFDAGEILDDVAALAAAGAALVILYTAVDPPAAHDTVGRFAEQVVPRLPADPSPS